MSPRSYTKILAVVFKLVVAPAVAQVDLAVKKVIRVDKFEFAPSIIIPDIAKRFNAEPSSVESRLKGSALASLGQELSSSKLMELAVRDDSLKRLAEEWRVSEELGSRKGQDAIGIPTVADANYLAHAKVEELVVKRVQDKEFGVPFSRCYMIVDVSLEVTTREIGTKKVLQEVYEYNWVERSVVNSSCRYTHQPEIFKNRLEQKYNILDGDAGVIRGAMTGLSKKLAQRVLDSYCPIRITGVKGKLFNIDRGRAAGIKEGHIMELTERVDDESETDPGFPIAQARAKAVKEDSTLMELLSDEGVEELKRDRSKLTVTRPVEEKFAEPELKPIGPSKK